MKKNNLHIGNQKISINEKPVTGNYISIDEEPFYKISNYDKMNPFLISIVSADDHWMYISSKGGITAGRKNPDNALFPYSNDDKLHDIHEITGSKTIIKVFNNEDTYLWEPFSDRFEGVYSITRNLYKNVSGTKIIFEEKNDDLNLVFKFYWTTSIKFGFVKHSELINTADHERKIELIDGIQNVLPSGIFQQLQAGFSTLVDGYKKNELIENSGLGVFSLSSIPSDRAIPSESLICTTVFSTGIEVDKFLLSSKQLNSFRKNYSIEQETNSKGIRGAYFINTSFELESGISKNWYIVAEVNQNAGDLIKLIEYSKNKNLLSDVADDIQKSRMQLRKIVAQADGIQLNGRMIFAARHFANVLFNIMRGGIFNDSYVVEKNDFISFIRNANPYVIKAHSEFLENLENEILHSELLKRVRSLGDPHFNRLALEYLPLTFSRRHGDPSRPWNNFSIDIKDKNDKKTLNYQGNWRDIFQNWEALALSYPKYLESMISKFLNNSTADGYNPYRIFRDGFDWEEQEPENPWANIGYWGDHQIIYLLKLLELSKEFNPSALYQLLDEKIFSYANVPYRIKEYDDILENPRDTIVFDFQLNKRLRLEEDKFGSDSKYLKSTDNTLIQVNLIEKLLLTLLIKISNFIPGGGIWMNTQRPEWNDANNALVGYGISMVTLYYIRRYLFFLKNFLNESGKSKFKISEEVVLLFEGINSTLNENRQNLLGNTSDAKRKEVADKLGRTASDYRKKIYQHGFSDAQKEISNMQVVQFIELCLPIIDETIKKNKRQDGLYHSYNILHLSDNEMKVTNLYEMLEGQVAILSSGYLSADQSVELLESLKQSRLYRSDQNSYILYPDKELSLFIDKNNIAAESIERSKLLQLMVEDSKTDIIYKDVNGGFHFQSDIINSEVLKGKLESLLSDPKYGKYGEEESEIILDIYEKIFNHKQFTGRATTFYKYEGLGSIYWHMVSKLLLAVNEVYFKADFSRSENEKKDKLRKIYYDIKDGIGVEKSPDKYGAIPTDPYSHTPSFAGVQQPGMTGQVKEDIISRTRELGIHIKAGKIIINPSLLEKKEFTLKEETFTYYDLSGTEKKINCSKNSIAFTYCQVPFIYQLAGTNKIIVQKENGESVELNNLEFDEALSNSIFNREGKIVRVEVSIDSKLL